MADSTTNPSTFNPSTFNPSTFGGSTPTRRAHRGGRRLRAAVVAISLGMLAAFVPIASSRASASPGSPTPDAVVDVQARIEAALSAADRVQTCPLSEKLASIDLSTADKEVRETFSACVDARAELASRADDVETAYSEYVACLQRNQGDCFVELFGLSAAELLLSRQHEAVIAACFGIYISNGF